MAGEQQDREARGQGGKERRPNNSLQMNVAESAELLFDLRKDQHEEKTKRRTN